jgi:hypothetical protein
MKQSHSFGVDFGDTVKIYDIVEDDAKQARITLWQLLLNDEDHSADHVQSIEYLGVTDE